MSIDSLVRFNFSWCTYSGICFRDICLYWSHCCVADWSKKKIDPSSNLMQFLHLKILALYHLYQEESCGRHGLHAFFWHCPSWHETGECVAERQIAGFSRCSFKGWCPICHQTLYIYIYVCVYIYIYVSIYIYIYVSIFEVW